MAASVALKAAGEGMNPDQPSAVSTGRLLRIFRMASRLSLDEAAIASFVASQRLRELEAGRGEVKFMEAIHIAKAYGLCQPCFRRHFESAAERDLALAVDLPPRAIWPVPSEPGSPGPTVWIDEATEE